MFRSQRASSPKRLAPAPACSIRSLYDNGFVRSGWRNSLIYCMLGVLVAGHAQVIEFESNGLKYQTLTRNGVTVMFAHMPQHVREYAILQVSVSNGSRATHVARPEDFTFVRSGGAA